MCLCAEKEWTSKDSLYGARHLARKWELLESPLQSSAVSPVIQKAKEGLKGISQFVLLDLIGTKDMKAADLSRRIQIRNYNSKSVHFYRHIRQIERMLLRSEALSVSQVAARSHLSNFYFDSNVRVMNAVEDDHIPFLQRGVPILHLIPIPFPSVWHKASDRLDAIDWDVVEDWCLLMRVYLADCFSFPLK